MSDNTMFIEIKTYPNYPVYWAKNACSNSVDPDQTAPGGAV